MFINQGDVAQLGERGLCKPEVVGSIPIVSTMNCQAEGNTSAFFVAVPATAIENLSPINVNIYTLKVLQGRKKQIGMEGSVCLSGIPKSLQL